MLLIYCPFVSRNLLDNLDKGIRKGGNFSLRSCIRIRAACRPHNSSGVMQQSGATLRYEALLPNVSYRVVQIHSLPILATPLAASLANTSLHDRESHGLSGPPLMRMGFLSLSSTRQVVPLLQPKSSCMSTPVVGVWVCLSELILDSYGGGPVGRDLAMLRNPYVWGACVWYMRNESILERVWEAPGVFLLVSTFFASTLCVA